MSETINADIRDLTPVGPSSDPIDQEIRRSTEALFRAGEQGGQGELGYNELGRRATEIERLVRESGRVDQDMARSPGDDRHRTEYDVERAHNAALTENSVRDKYEEKRKSRMGRLGRKALSVFGIKDNLDEREQLDIRIATDSANRQYDQNPLKDLKY